MDTRIIEPKIESIANKLIQDQELLEYIRNSEVRIAYLVSDHALKKNGKSVFGQCEKIQEKYKWTIPYDFTITLFQPNIEHLTADQIEILVFHELLHVGIKEGSDGEKYKIIPHDLEDFDAIIRRYGIDWSKE